MKVHYDDEVDALYLQLDDHQPDGVIEIAEGINLDTTSDGRLTGIEILNASKKFNIETILTYKLELDMNIFNPKAVSGENYSQRKGGRTGAITRIHPRQETPHAPHCC